MKKILIIAGLCMIAATNAFAQCVEVKGVETKIVCYADCNPKDESKLGAWVSGMVSGSNLYKYPKSGFKFTNMSKYQVTIEAEFWKQQEENGSYDNKTIIPAKIIQPKTFVLEAGEEYVWKVGMEASYQNENYGTFNNHYVKFKAFKCP
jgi:hypothetical protein